MSKNLTSLLLSKVRVDGGTQSRAEIDEDYCAELAEAIDALPSAIVYHDGESYWLADGFQRRRAHELARRRHMIVEVRLGTRRDAVLFSVGANATHGLRRTNADKRRAAETLLADGEWGRWSDAEIARRCGVSDRFVSAVRKQLSPNDSGMRTARRGDQVYDIDVAGLTSPELYELPPEEQVIRHRLEEQAAAEALASEAAPKREDDGLRSVVLRRPALIVQLYQRLDARRQREINEGFDRLVRRRGKDAA
jgi:hypothetical protein